MEKQINELIKRAEVLDNQIDQYYESYLKELIKENDKDDSGISYVIMPLGLHYESSLITLALTRPKQILFLYTKESLGTLERIKQLFGLNNNKYQAFEVDDADPLQVYKVIEECYISWDKPSKVYIDVTGGTKAMSVATTLAGVTINAEFLYIATENYIKAINRPEIGTEQLVILKNPIEIYGDLDADMALEHMEAFDYISALEIFKQLMNKALDSSRRQYYRILYLLATGYEHWDNLEFKEAHTCFNQMIELIENASKNYGQFVLVDQLDNLKLQRKILNSLAYDFENSMNFEIVKDLENVLALVMTIYRSAIRRREQQKFDMAVLLLYRLIEVIGQRRLAVNGIDYEDPNFYEVLGERRYIELKVKFNKIKNNVFNDRRTYKPPRRHITLLDSYFLLGSMNDRLFRDKKKIGFLKELYQYCKIRNQSVFAHGFKVIDEEQYFQFEKFVEGLLTDFSQLEQIDLEAYKKNIKFINPESTKYIK